MQRPQRWLVASFALTALAAAPLAGAQVARSGGSANAQALQQMQQLAQERTALQAENDKLKSELADVKKERDSLKAGQQALDRRSKDATAALAHSDAARASTEQELAQSKAKMQELIGKFRDTIQKFRELEADDTRDRQTLATHDKELALCVEHNVSMHDLNQEVLTRLEHHGVWSRAAESEPFTQIARVRNENLVDGYRARADELKVPPAPVSPPPAPTPALPQGVPEAAPPAAAPPAAPPPGDPTPRPGH